MTSLIPELLPIADLQSTFIGDTMVTLVVLAMLSAPIAVVVGIYRLFRGPKASTPMVPDVPARLSQLESLWRSSQITEEEYQTHRRRILDSL